MSISGILDSSALFSGKRAIAAVVPEDPWRYNYNRTLHRLTAGQGFEATYHALDVAISGRLDGSIQISLDYGGQLRLSSGPPEERVWKPKLEVKPGQATRVGDEDTMKFSISGGSVEIDYLLYGPSPSWSAAGSTLLLDDQDELWTTFSGTWNRTSNTTFPTGNAMKKTISQTRTVGSSFKTGFVGSNIQVYGALQQVPGSVTVDYNIDGTFSDTVTLSPSSQEVNETNWELNRLLFGHSDESFYGDESAEHTLEFTIVDITGEQMFSLDYLTFEGTRWTNVTSPGFALTSPFAEPGSSNSNKRNLAIGLGVSLPLALIIGVALFFVFKRRRGTKSRG
ncbi:hypothetical protein BKA70DRAFT_1218811 [Coprinopsis sp. MPI-PUGE-AT-0042]|nr:hypothetical protein BKA70DRAFT_1218811 [Coprinopsis sp. MPI-PUGE-AT-0042]